MLSSLPIYTGDLETKPAFLLTCLREACVQFLFKMGRETKAARPQERLFQARK